MRVGSTTRIDLYACSASGKCADGKRLRPAVECLAARVPDSRAFGWKNVSVGEFGIPESNDGSTGSLAGVRGTVMGPLAWGCLNVIFWQLTESDYM